MGDQEQVVRLLHSKIDDPRAQRIDKRELWPPLDRDKNPVAVANACHSPLGSHGSSLFRRFDLTTEDIRERSKIQAERRPGREPRGAIAGQAGELRGISTPRLPGKQVVYVYDDPIAGDDKHCIIRCHTEARVDRDYLRDLIILTLSTTIPQTDD